MNLPNGLQNFPFAALAFSAFFSQFLKAQKFLSRCNYLGKYGSFKQAIFACLPFGRGALFAKALQTGQSFLQFLEACGAWAAGALVSSLLGIGLCCSLGSFLLPPCYLLRFLLNHGPSYLWRPTAPSCRGRAEGGWRAGGLRGCARGYCWWCCQTCFAKACLLCKYALVCESNASSLCALIRTSRAIWARPASQASWPPLRHVRANGHGQERVAVHWLTTQNIFCMLMAWNAARLSATTFPFCVLKIKIGQGWSSWLLSFSKMNLYSFIQKCHAWWLFKSSWTCAACKPESARNENRTWSTRAFAKDAFSQARSCWARVMSFIACQFQLHMSWNFLNHGVLNLVVANHAYIRASSWKCSLARRNQKNCQLESFTQLGPFSNKKTSPGWVTFVSLAVPFNIALAIAHLPAPKSKNRKGHQQKKRTNHLKFTKKCSWRVYDLQIGTAFRSSEYRLYSNYMQLLWNKGWDPYSRFSLILVARSPVLPAIFHLEAMAGAMRNDTNDLWAWILDHLKY